MAGLGVVFGDGDRLREPDHERLRVGEGRQLQEQPVARGEPLERRDEVAIVRIALPQLLEGGGVFVDPDDEEGWVRAWTHLLENPGQRETLGRGALEAARALTWERAADRLLAALEEAAS